MERYECFRGQIAELYGRLNKEMVHMLFPDGEQQAVRVLTSIAKLLELEPADCDAEIWGNAA